jgi:hypothetical protein
MGGDDRYADVPAATNDEASAALISEYRRIRTALVELGIDPDAPPPFELVA